MSTLASNTASAQILKATPTGDLVFSSTSLGPLFIFSDPNNEILNSIGPGGGDRTALTLPADNLPTLTLHLFLEAEWFDGVQTYLPQLGITWCPLLITPYGIRPLAAPMIVPVAAPISYNARVPASVFGFSVRHPIQAPATYNNLRYHMGVSQ